MRLFVGGYTADMDGTREGIGVLHAGSVDSPLLSGALSVRPDAVATGGSPSWIAWHPTLDVIYAALEGDRTVQAFARTGAETFEPLGDAVEAGEAVCHVQASPDGSMLLASCWGDGRLVKMTLDAKGRPSNPVLAPETVDPYAAPAVDAADFPALAATGLGDLGALIGSAAATPEDEPEVRPSRAHQALFLPGGLVATTDLGRDVVRLWRQNGTRLEFVQSVTLPKGSGPRHMAWHPSGHLFVLTEMSCEVFALAPDAAGDWRVVSGSPLGAGTADTDTAAEITLSRDGAFVVAGVRGTDTLATLRVVDGGAGFAQVALTDAGVRNPRNHVLSRDTLLVAGRRSDDVVSLNFDERTGIPSAVRQRTEVATPTCLLLDRV